MHIFIHLPRWLRFRKSAAVEFNASLAQENNESVNYDSIAWNYHQQCYVKAQRKALRENAWIAKQLPLLLKAGDKPIYDLGCGTGYWSRVLADLNFLVVGIDRSSSNLDVARQVVPDCVDLFPYDISHLPLIENSTDNVLLM